jgi:ketosteroid isomerase-like protein
MRACLGFLLLASPAFTQPVEQIIERLTTEWMTAVGNKDDASLNRIMADEFIAHLPDSGRAINRSEWLRQARLMENAECDYKSTQVRNYGDYAIASGRLTCRGDIKGIGLEDDSIVTDTWVRRDNQWKVSLRVASTAPRFTGIWQPLAIGAGIPSLLWMIVAVRSRLRQSSSLLSSANRPYY